MKIVDITTYFHPQSGGIKRYLLEKAKFFNQLPYQHILILPGINLKSYYLHRTKVYEFPSFLIPRTGGYRWFKSINKIKEILDIEKPDIVEIGGSYFLIPFLKSQKYKLITFYHSDLKTYLSLIPLPESLKKKFLQSFIKRFLNLADYVIAPSKKMEEILKSLGINKVKTINLGLDVGTFKLKEVIKGLDSFYKPIKILYVGRLSPEKNLDLLIKIFLKLPSEKFEVWIIGNGSLRKKVERFVKIRPNTKYFGYISDERTLADLYNQADLFVSTSINETFGLSFLEAQACGCILIAKYLGLETQPFKDFLVEDLNIETFYETIYRAYLSLSPSLKLKISSYIREHFSWEITFQKLKNFYESLLN